jgi:outer membrane protein OmpA-like peptidoglycan-associated protein
MALLGLAASFVTGFFLLVPQLEPVLVRTEPATTEPEPGVAASVAADDLAAPETEPEPAPLPPAEPAEDYCHDAMVAALGNARIEFLSASAEIIPASRNVVSVLAALAHTCPGRIVIDGHSDNLGPERINEQISLDRAQAVVDAFAEFGIEPRRLQARGFGSSRPIADNTTAAGRARNRRIEMSLVEDEPPSQTGE